MNHTRCLLADAKMYASWWPPTIRFVCWCRNRVITQASSRAFIKIINNKSIKVHKTPYEVLFDNKPEISHARRFGCLCYVKNSNRANEKLDDTWGKGAFMGYHNGLYKVYKFEGDATNHYAHQNVIFKEEINAFHAPNAPLLQRMNPQLPQINDSMDIQQQQQQQQQHQIDMRNRINSMDIRQLNESRRSEIQQLQNRIRELNHSRGLTSALVAEAKVQDHTVTTSNYNNCAYKNNIQKMNELTSNYNNCAYVATKTWRDVKIPQSYNEAMKSPQASEWKLGMESEMNSLKKNNVFELTELPQQRKAISCKWVFDAKTNELGEVMRYKARLVARGFSQIEGIDYTETYSPVLAIRTFRILIALATQLKLKIYNFDITTAFLNGELDEIIYLQQPPGFIDQKHSKRVWRLNKALYGLRQASRKWNQKLVEFLINECDAKQSKIDECVFIIEYEINGIIYIIYIGIFVDDIFFIGTEQQSNEFYNKLKSRFECKNLGECTFYLGIHVIRDMEKHTTSISQQLYCDQILERFEMHLTKQSKVKTPATGTILKPREINDKTLIEFPYREAVGSLIHIMNCTRPDIAYAVIAVAAHVSNPSLAHVQAVKRIYRYLMHTKNFGLKYTFNSEQKVTAVLVGFTDSNYGNIYDGRSTVGYVMMMNGAPISYYSRKLKTVATSTTEAEFHGQLKAIQDVVFTKMLLESLQLKPKQPIILHADNQAAIALAHAEGMNNRSKHFAQHFYYVRQQINNRQVDLNYIRSEENIADIFTKPITHQPLFEELRTKMGVVEVDMRTQIIAHAMTANDRNSDTINYLYECYDDEVFK